MNPFLSAPRLPSPVKSTNKRLSLHTRTNSRPRDVDSLLRDLSPTTTLRAFRADPTSTSVDMALGSSNADIIARSIESSSESERALGAKAAQACLDLRTWMREMESWTWPGSFDVPEPVQKTMRMEIEVLRRHDSEEYWGSLPANIVRAYEQRADEIGQQLDEIDVEELKEYVLSSHYRANSRPPSRSHRLSMTSTLDMVTSNMKTLDDFTALVTATILQALPFLTRLNRLLDVWTIRLIILRTAPQYLRGLNRARRDLDQAWAAISASATHGVGSNDVTVGRQAVFQMKSSFEHQVGTLGRKLDRFLDDLEGREDRVPDSWIDDFENLESAYGTWVAQADRKVLESEWRLSRGPETAPNIARDQQHVSDVEEPTLDADAVGRPAADTSVSNNPFANFDQAADANVRALSPSIDAVPIPIIPQNSLVVQPAESNIRSISERLAPGVEEPSSHRAVSDSAAQEEGAGGLVAKRRAAFLNDIERTNSLKLASKSPVRSFEHASNAFTRLFKKDRSPEKPRPVPKRSGSSKSSFNGQLNTVLASSIRSPSPSTSTQEALAGTTQVEDAAKTTDFTTTTLSTDFSGNTIDSDATLVQRASHSRDVSPELVYQVQSAIGSGHSGPETYKPSRLSSPFASPSKTQVPEDWPLGGPSETLPGVAQQQQNHDDPTTDLSLEEPASALQPVAQEISRDTAIITDPIIDGGSRTSETDAAWLVDSNTEIGSSTTLQTDAFDRMFVETLPPPPQETPGSVNAPERSAPWTGSRRRHSLPRPRRGSMSGMLRRLSVSSSYLENEYASASPSADELTLVTFPVDFKTSAPEEDERKWLKRASSTFIEAFPRSQLKSINVVSSPRRGSTKTSSRRSSVLPESITPAYADMPIETSEATNITSVGYQDVVVEPSPPRQSSEAHMGEHVNPNSTTYLPPNSYLGETSPAPEAEPESPLQLAPLNAVMMKRRGNNVPNDENIAPMYTLGPASHSKKGGQFRQGEDSFDRHVSEVLNTLPAPIKFRSRPGAETPVHQQRTGEGRQPLGPRPKNTSDSHAPSRTGMMIAPAESSPKKSSSASDPEVKLYHLTQAGRDEPIKLFVRLVGEGERVMVRVGGGWADLADYLRQYAEHHGSRTVSDGGLEMQTALNGHSRRISGPVELKARPAPATPNPESGSATPFRPGSHDSEKEWSQRRPGSSRAETGGLSDMTNTSPFSARAQTPNPYGTNTRSSTPKSSSGSSNSRPSTANGPGGPGSSRPSSRQSLAGEGYGLAGPSSAGKRGMLPDHKAKWVDSMIERAKASAEKSKESAAKEKYFGELGKAGGTRRLVFRSGSGTGGPDKK